MWVFSRAKSACSSTAVLGLTIIALVWGATLFHLREERRQALEASEQNVSNLARSFEEHVIRSLQDPGDSADGPRRGRHRHRRA